MAPVRWKIRHLIAITTILALYFGLSNTQREDTQLPLLVAATLALAVASINERKIPQWARVVLAIIFVAALVNFLSPVIY